MLDVKSLKYFLKLFINLFLVYKDNLTLII